LVNYPKMPPAYRRLKELGYTHIRRGSSQNLQRAGTRRITRRRRC